MQFCVRVSASNFQVQIRKSGGARASGNFIRFLAGPARIMCAVSLLCCTSAADKQQSFPWYRACACVRCIQAKRDSLIPRANRTGALNDGFELVEISNARSPDCLCSHRVFEASELALWKDHSRPIEVYILLHDCLPGGRNCPLPLVRA